MKLSFEIDGDKIEFSRNWFNGIAKITSDRESRVLQSALNPATHFNIKLTKQWRHSVGNHEIIIEKVRPIFFAGFRPQTYRIYVDKQLIKEAKGF